LVIRLLVACLAALPVAASAETLIALSAGQQLVRFDSAAPGTVTTRNVLGRSGNLLCIESNLRTHLVFALAITPQSDFFPPRQVRSHMIDPETGQATLGSSTSLLDGISDSIACDAVPSYHSYNAPYEPGYRVISAVGAHQKYDENTTSSVSSGPATPPAFVAGDANEGKALSIHGLAYTNPSFDGTTSTLYGLDLTNGVLVRIGSPGNSPDSADTGKTTTIGSLGITLVGDSTANFDISDTTGTAYATLETSAGVGLYTIDLATGAATLVGLIGDGTVQLRGLTVHVPPDGDGGGGTLDPSLLLGLLALGWRRRKIGRGERI